MRGDLHKFDLYFTNTIQHWPAWLQPLMQFASVVGHPGVTVTLAAGIVGVGWMQNNLRLLLAGGAALVVIGVGTLLKLVLHRARPLTDYVFHMRFDTFSFPSGHTTGATVCYGLLAFLAWQLLPQSWAVVSTVLLVLLIILVGISRIYLGAHYPSDVIGGWLLGLVGLIIIIFVIHPKI